MQWLAQICVKRPVFAMVLVLSLVVVGIFGYTSLGVDRFPKVDFNVVTITVKQEGASPEEIETDIVDKIEEAVNTVSGIDQLSSTSYEGVGVVIVTFTLEKDINIALQEVRDKVNTKLPDLPIDIKSPVVDKVDPDSSPILEIALSSPGTVRDTTEYADKVLRRRLESLPGVGEVKIIGGRKRQINIITDIDRMRALSITAADIQKAVQGQNIQVPGGLVEQKTRDLTLRTHGRVLKPAEFNDVIIAQRGVTTIKLSEVARVEDGTEVAMTGATIAEKDSKAQPTVLLSIRKQSGLNTVTTVKAIKERLSEINDTLPKGYGIRITRDQSTYIIAATDSVKEHLVVGSILAALVVLIFLWNWRTTLISALAIPASIISTFGLMSYMNFTLNGLTLLALTLSVGIVIDDAIVVLENIYRFIEEKGMNPFQAAIEGTKEIGLAVLATTLSLVAVFLPVAFMTGIVGRFLNSFGITMAFAILVSLLVSFTLTPMLAARWIKAPKPTLPTEGEEVGEGMPVGSQGATGAKTHGESSSKQSGFFKVLDSGYTVLLKFSMAHRWVIVVACILSLLSLGPLFMMVPKDFLPTEDESKFEISLRAAEGTNLDSTLKVANDVAEDVRNLGNVKFTVSSIGNGSQPATNVASIFVKMVGTDNRKLSQLEFMQKTRQLLSKKYNYLRTSVNRIQEFSTGSPAATIVYYIAGADLQKLTEYSQKIVTELKKVPGATDVDTSLIVGKPELGVTIDRQRAGDLGVSVIDISNALRTLVGGQKVTDFYDNGEQYEVHVRADRNFRSDPDVISRMTVPSTKLGSVPLDQVVSFTNGSGPSQITRLGRRRYVQILANVLPGYGQSTITDKIETLIKDQHMPAGYESGALGTSKELAKAGKAFVAAFLLALIFMYLILAAQFESWVHPITILSALPLTVPYAILALVIFHQSLNIFSVLGILVLFGVVKKNGILQVDHTNHLRSQGMNRYDAIITANRDRLRPILMTTFAFVVGMIPLVISNGTGSATNRTIGFAVIGGQSLSLILTLLATPVIYSILDDFQNFFRRNREPKSR